MIHDPGNVKPSDIYRTEEHRRQVRTYSLTDLGFWVASGAAVGAATGALAGGIGAIPGAIAGALTSFIAYTGAYFTGLAVEGFTGDPTKALVARRLAEVALPAGYLSKLLKLSRLKSVFKVSRSEPIAPIGPIAKLVAKTPSEIKTGLKIGSFALTTRYVLEPYIMRDPEAGEGRPLGVAALAASAWIISRPLAPLGLWAKYSTQQILSTLTPKAGAGVLITDPIQIGERLRLPKL